MKKWIKLIVLILLPFIFIQCGTSEIMTSQTTISKDKLEYQFSDSTIAEYFTMMPQINPPLKISVFEAGRQPWHLATDLEALPSVQHANYITPALIRLTGTNIPRTYGYSDRYFIDTIDLMQLRSLAAQSHSDLILYVEPSHEVKGGANPLALTYAGILPMFFIKGNSVEVVSIVDVYLIDVRNGFIYTSFRNIVQSKKKYVKVNYRKDADKLIAKNQDVLIESVIQEIKRSLGNEQFFADNDINRSVNSK